jgi:hypothetical protein
MRAANATAEPFIPDDERFAKVKENSSLIRDTGNHALLSNNLDALNAYKQKKKRSSQIETLGTEINNLKSDMVDIKAMLNQIIQKS